MKQTEKKTNVFSVNAGIIRLNGKVPTMGDNYQVEYKGKRYGVAINRVLLSMCTGELCCTIHFKGYFNNSEYALKYQNGNFQYFMCHGGYYAVCKEFSILDRYTHEKVKLYARGMDVILNCSLSWLMYKAGDKFIGTYYTYRNSSIYNGFKNISSIDVQKFADTYCIGEINDNLSKCYSCKEDVIQFEVEKTAIVPYKDNILLSLPKYFTRNQAIEILEKHVKKTNVYNVWYNLLDRNYIFKSDVCCLYSVDLDLVKRSKLEWLKKPIVPINKVEKAQEKPQQVAKQLVGCVDFKLDIYAGENRTDLHARAIEMCNKKLDELSATIR